MTVYTVVYNIGWKEYRHTLSLAEAAWMESRVSRMINDPGNDESYLRSGSDRISVSITFFNGMEVKPVDYIRGMKSSCDDLFVEMKRLAI